MSGFFSGIEVWQMALALVAAITLFVLVFFGAMARFLKRPSPSEAIIRIGRATTDVFIARACWIVPVLHRAATMSLSTIGLTIRRDGHEALVTKDFISTNLSAEFYIRVEPNDDDVKKAARTIGIDEGRASTDDILGASGRETVTTTVVEKNIAVKRKMQDEAQRTAEIAREQEINVATQNRIMHEGKAKEDEAAAKAELSKNEAIETRDLQRQANIAVERARKEQAEQAAAIGKQKVLEAAQVDKDKTIEAALVDKQITLTLKAKDSAEADAQKASALALKEKADQEVITVGQVAEAERQKQVAIVAAQRAAEQQKIAAEVEAYKKKLEAEAVAAAQRAAAEGAADAVKI